MELSQKLGWLGILVGLGGIGVSAFIAYADPSWIPEAWHPFVAIGGLCVAVASFLGAFILLVWPRLKSGLPGYRRRRRDAGSEADSKLSRKRTSAIQTIIADYGQLLHERPQQRRAIFDGLATAALGLWKYGATPAEKEEDQPLYRAWQTILDLKAQPGETPLDRLGEAVRLIAALEGLKWAVARHDVGDSHDGQGNHPRLSVTPRVDALSHAYPVDNYLEGMLEMALHDRAYAVLTVRNLAERGFSGVKARCQVPDLGIEIPCFWSTKPGSKFVPGDAYSADIPVDHERTLVIAQVFGRERLWSRLPEEPRILFDPVGTTDRAPRLVSRAGEILDLGRRVELQITFKAEGLDQSDGVLLSFGPEGPTLERVTPPAAPPPTKSGS